MIRKGWSKIPVGKKLMGASILSRTLVLLFLTLIAYESTFINYKTGFNNPRLVELSSGPAARILYETVNALFSWSGEPVQSFRGNSGMTWSIRVFGIPFTDPVAGISSLTSFAVFAPGFYLGLIFPLLIAAVFGRVFCSYICPASLLFFSVSRIRNFLRPYFLLPEFQPGRMLAWGILFGGIISALVFSHGVWIFILPYFSMGQTIYSGIAQGMISSTLIALLFFSLMDLLFGKNFTCRNVCPTGRLLGAIGSRSVISVKRDSSKCVDRCRICTEVCPLGADPKRDLARDCSLCGECMVLCPASCLSAGKIAELPALTDIFRTIKK